MFGACCRAQRISRRSEGTEVVFGWNSTQLQLFERFPGRRLHQGDVCRRQQVGGASYDVSRFVLMTSRQIDTNKNSYTPQYFIAKRCSRHPGDVEHGYRKGSIFMYPHRVEYTCADGYALKGNQFRECQADGEWSGEKPSCERMTSRKHAQSKR